MRDAVVVGVLDETWGEAVVAVVEGEPVEQTELIAHVKARLAGYQAPKRVVRIDTIGRAVNGKVDYKGLRACASSV